MTTINNMKPYATDYPYIVARRVDGDWWFWGAYSTRDRAAKAAWEIGGEVFETEEVESGNK